MAVLAREKEININYQAKEVNYAYNKIRNNELHWQGHD